MGLFSKRKKETTKNRVILSMPMFAEGGAIDIDALVKDLKSHWNIEVAEFSSKDMVHSFKIGEDFVAVAAMDAPIPMTDLEPMFGHSYLWKNVETDVPEHTSHAIVTIMGSETDTVERYKMLTMINSSLLRTSHNAIGIYQGAQTLLLPKDLYIDFADMLLEGMLPLQLWVYVGIINKENTASIYTYGMKEFDKQEMEIIDSSMSGGELYDLLLPMLNYVIGSNVILRDGETIGLTTEQKIKITESKGVFLDGKTLKLEI